MTARTVTCVVVTCNRCTRIGPDDLGVHPNHFATLTDARFDLDDAGWHVDETGAALCPTCIPAGDCDTDDHAWQYWAVDPPQGQSGAAGDEKWHRCRRCGAYRHVDNPTAIHPSGGTA